VPQEKVFGRKRKKGSKENATGSSGVRRQGSEGLRQERFAAKNSDTKIIEKTKPVRHMTALISTNQSGPAGGGWPMETKTRWKI